MLELLRIPTLVVALTKTDLVDDEWVEFMIDEVKGRLAGGPYENAEIIAVSSRTGEGLDDLKAALGRAAKATKRQKASDSARLPIDRVFTIKGAGTVITGTLWSGTISIGDELEVLPSGRMSRVRSIQIHGESIDRAEAGHRVALNLNALSTEEVRPGDFLAALRCRLHLPRPLLVRQTPRKRGARPCFARNARGHRANPSHRRRAGFQAGRESLCPNPPRRRASRILARPLHRAVVFPRARHRRRRRAPRAP